MELLRERNKILGAQASIKKEVEKRLKRDREQEKCFMNEVDYLKWQSDTIVLLTVIRKLDFVLDDIDRIL